MTTQDESIKRIADAIEEIAENGITIHIEFPTDVDKFVLDLASLKISEAIDGISNALDRLSDRIE